MTRLVPDTLVMAERNLVRLPRAPDLLLGFTVQPIMFVLLFVYVFGGAIETPGYDDYVDFLIPGILAQNIAFGGFVTALGLAEDMTKGLIDRFRSLPTARASVLAGRTVADVVTNTLSIVVLLVTGLIIGFGFDAGPLEVLAGVGLLLLFGYAFSWIFALIGLSVSSPEAANGIGFTLIFPITFISSAFVPVESMPAGLQEVAAANPARSWTRCAHSGSARRRATTSGCPWSGASCWWPCSRRWPWPNTARLPRGDERANGHPDRDSPRRGESPPAPRRRSPRRAGAGSRGRGRRGRSRPRGRHGRRTGRGRERRARGAALPRGGPALPGSRPPARRRLGGRGRATALPG